MGTILTIVAILLAFLFVVQYFRNERDVNRLDVAGPLFVAVIVAIIAYLL